MVNQNRLVLAQRVNFTIDLLLEEKEKWGALYPNSSSTGAMNLIIDKKADFTIGKFAMTSHRNAYMTPSISYYSSPLIIVVPVGEPFTSLERLLKPFRVIIWSLVLAILIITFLVITFIKWKCDETVQSFIFGARNSSPLLNVLNIFLGGSLHQLPMRNFARTILCVFMIYCLVVRSSYTGLLFTFIKTDVIRKPSIDSIDAMVEQDFKFHMIPSAEELTAEVPKVYERRVIIKPSEVSAVREKMINPSFKGGMLSSLEQIVYFNMMNHRNFTFSVCHEQLFAFQYSIYFQKNSYLVDRFDEELLLFQTNGLIDKVVNQFVQFSFLRPEKSQRSPSAFVLTQFKGSFQILIFGLSIASLVAGLETLSRKVSALRSVFGVV